MSDATEDDGRSEDKPWGRLTPGLIGEQTDFSTQHILTRTDALIAGQYIRKLDRGIYEITQRGVTAIEEGDSPSTDTE